MPISPHEQADILRAVGRFLDLEGAREIEIHNHAIYLTLSWRGKNRSTDERTYVDQELSELREQARLQRSNVQYDPRGSLAELLRTLGQDLQAERGDFTHIQQTGDTIFVTAAVGGQYVRRKYLAADLLKSSRARRGGRRGTGRSQAATGQATAPGRPSAPPWDDGPLARRFRH